MPSYSPQPPKQKKKTRIKDYLPQSLFGRTMLIIIAPLILLQLAATTVFIDRHWVKMTDRLSAAVAGELATICAIIEESNADPDIIKGLSEVVTDNQEIQISFQSEQLLPNNKQNARWIGVRTSFANALRRKIEHPFEIKVDFAKKQIDVWIQLEQGILHAKMPERRLFSSSGYIFILWLIGLSLMFFAISVWLMRNQIRPIHRLASAANRLGKGQDVSFFKPTGAREVRLAAESFLKMRDRIHRQVEQRTAMLAGVSHDLRTPITRLKLQMEMMADIPPTLKDIEDMQEDLHEMEVMIEAYLAFAKGMDYEDTESIELIQFIKNISQRFESKEKKIKTESHIENISIGLRRNQITRAFSNIISNALKYGDMLKIEISTTQHDYEHNKEVTIKFIDNGPGIPQDEFERVFRPFYRIESSRNKKTGGIGLGLSICQDIINGHGGRIWLSSPMYTGNMPTATAAATASSSARSQTIDHQHTHKDQSGLVVIVTLPL